MNLTWQAEPELAALIRRYYGGEAGLWPEIRALIDAELRRRNISDGAYHIRLRSTGDTGYTVVITDASAYRIAPDG